METLQHEEYRYLRTSVVLDYLLCIKKALNKSFNNKNYKTMKKLLLLAAAAVSLCANADYYIIGANVNGSSWALAQEDAKFTAKGDGIYEWTGEVLGTGFKINDGTWDNPDFNFGGDGSEKLSLGNEFWLTTGNESKDIQFNGFTDVKNPVVTFNEAEGTVTVAGEASGVAKWFFTGDFNSYNLEQYELAPQADGTFLCKNVELPESGLFQIAQTGWSDKHGAGDDATIMITPEKLSTVLIPFNTPNGGECPFTVTPGAYDISWDLENTTVTFVAAGSAVETIDAENNAPAVYYNLQGVRVNNPKNGIFVKVAGNKAVKVNIAK